MTRQGRCWDATQAPVNILDRLEGLSKVVPPEVMDQALSETGMSGQRSCKLSHRVMLGIVLAMGLLTHLPIRQVFKHARRMRPHEKTPSRSNLCEARQRLGVEPVRRVFELVVHPLATPETPGAFSKGYRLMGIDGTVRKLGGVRPRKLGGVRPSFKLTGSLAGSDRVSEAWRGQTEFQEAWRGQTEFQVNLKLGLTPRFPPRNHPVV